MRRGLVLAFSSLLAVGVATGQDPGVAAAVNSASNEELLSPGVLADIFGQNLTNGCTESAPGVPWPTTLCDMQVLVDDKPAAIVSASPGQFTVQFPVDAEPGPATLTLQQPSTAPLSFALSGRVEQAELAITLETHAPGIFVVTHADSSAISMENPAIPGEILQLFATGLGPTNPPVGTGEPGPSSPLAVTVTMPDVKIADMDAPVLAAGLTPFLVGTFGVAFTLPVDLAEGTHALTLEIGGQTSNAVMIPVGAVPQPPPSIGAGGGDSGQPCSHCTVNFAQLDYQHLRRGPGGRGNVRDTHGFGGR